MTAVAGHLGNSRRGHRFALMAVAAGALVAGLWAGLSRLGLPLPGGALAEWHGALMISAFLGTLISLERAVAIGRWAYAAPSVSAAAAVALLAGMPWLAAPLFLLASLALLAVALFVAIRQPALFTAVPVVATACWGAGTLAWIAGLDMREVTMWWLAFLVLTIAAERLELSRLLAPPPASRILFVIAVVLILAGAARGELATGPALFCGIGLPGMAAWLVRYDVALRTIRQPGQPRFSAICMICGYAWLTVAGVLLLVSPPDSAAFSYDAAVHAVALGFVLSMLLGHAPIILPAVTGVRVQINAAAYLPLALLHLSLMLRIAGDLEESTVLRAASGPLTVLALAGYAGLLIRTSRAFEPEGSP
jgi:hypothetical protein